MIRHNISAGIEAIKENIAVIRAKFRPLLTEGSYDDDISRLQAAVPRMLDNMNDMATELNTAFDILTLARDKNEP